MGVCKADEIGLNWGQPSTTCLQSPYIVTGLVPAGFIDLHISVDILLESTQFLKMVSKRFSGFTTKFRKASFFKETLSNFL